MKKQKEKQPDELVEMPPQSFEEAMRKIVQVPKQDLRSSQKVRIRKKMKNDQQPKVN